MKKVKLIIGAALLLLSIALMVYVIVSVSANIPEAGYDTGMVQLVNYRPPYQNAGLVMVLLGILSVICFITGLVMTAVGIRTR